jgi:hypothetical protein
MQLIRNERTTRLGRLGEEIVAERLKQRGFSEVENLNAMQANFPFADLVAVRGGHRYLISVKARNEMRQGGRRRNDSYNLIQVRGPANARLKRDGKSAQEVTRMLLEQVHELAARHDAEPAWVTVALRTEAGTYSAYFGLVAELGLKRSVPMTVQACSTYVCLARDATDPRITMDLLNA